MWTGDQVSEFKSTHFKVAGVDKHCPTSVGFLWYQLLALAMLKTQSSHGL